MVSASTLRLRPGGRFALGCALALLLFACGGQTRSPTESEGTTAQALSVDAGQAPANDGATSPSGDAASTASACVPVLADAGSSTGLTSANIELTVSKNACATNLAQYYFNITNSTCSSVTLSDITIKYWIYDTSGQPVVPNVYYGGCIVDSRGSCAHPVTGVTVTRTPFGPTCGPDPSHQANWEIAISTTDHTQLATGQTWNQIYTAINLTNWEPFVPRHGQLV